MQRKATLILMMALALTLMAGTVAIGAPKEKRTICTPEGKTMEVPANSKGHKGATEGPCQEPPPPGPDPAILEACTAMGGELIEDTRCAVTYENTSINSGKGRDVGYLVGDMTKYYEWDETQFVGAPEEDFVVEQCFDLNLGSSGGLVPLFYPACYHPVYNPNVV